MDNREIGRALRELSLFFEMDEVEFKPRAFEKAAIAVESLDRPLATLYREGGTKALQEIPSIGSGIAERIEELLKKGRCRELEHFRRRTPVDVVSLASIEGIGASKIKALYEGLHIRTIDDLEKAASEGRVHELPHFKEKSEQNILQAISFYREATARHPIGEVLELASAIESQLRAVKGVTRVALAGSIRRRKETIGDFDILAASSRSDELVRAFVNLPDVTHVYAKGKTKTNVRLRNGMDADLRIVPESSFTAALLYFTGSKAHNIALRKIAQGLGLKLNEYGLFRDNKAVVGDGEEEIYERLGLEFIPPELREDAGEIEAAAAGTLPRLIQARDLRGDLQTQTKWSDGSCTIEELAAAAQRLGLEYIAITDHTRDLAMAHGAGEKELRDQIQAIERANAKMRDFRILSGAEVNIRRDGSLDVDDEMLARLDVVGAAVHGWFDLPREEMTRRVIRAIENPHVDILFHPLARQLGKRKAIDIDMDAIIAAALRTGTILEIDAQPDRLDLADTFVRRAIESGVKLSIDSDAHNPGDLRFPALYGISVARRGWASKTDVINTLHVERMLAALKPATGVTPHRRRRVAA